MRKAGGWFVFSINHPCFKPPSAGELIDHDNGTVRKIVGDYFTEGEVPVSAPGVE